MAALGAPPGIVSIDPEEATESPEEAIPQGNHPEPQLESQPEVLSTLPPDSTDNCSQRNTELHISGDDLPRQIRLGECGDRIGFRWPLWKKWFYLCVIFLVQVSMNLNTTLYSNGINGISLEYGISPFALRWGGAGAFLITYSFGCELWAPWSEELGRRIILQSSLFLVNCFAVLVATSPNLAGHVIGRVLGGLSSAGGSVTLAMITDMFEPDDPMFQHATSFIVFSSVFGSIIGPIIGGFVEELLPWRWCVWIQVIFGGFVQLLHFLIVPETRASIIMDRVAKEYRKSGKNRHVFGPSENRRIDWVDVGRIWMRPFRMFMTEPIVVALSLLSGFSDALIFMMVQSFGFVYWQYGFSPIQVGFCFIPIGLGYMFAYAAFFIFIMRNVSLRSKRPEDEYAQYESRLAPLLWMAPLLPIGLLIFAFTAAYFTTPIHWLPSMIGSFLIGIANFAIYMATIDYVLRAYGPFAASATGGNGWARDFLAGVLTPYAIPMYAVYDSPLIPSPLYYHSTSRHILTKCRYEKLSVFMATIVLVAIATVLCGAVFLVYKYGPWLRHHSKFAQTIAKAEADHGIVIGDRNGTGDENMDVEFDGTDRIANFLLYESRHRGQCNASALLPRTSLQIERSPAWYQLHRCRSLPTRPSYSNQSSNHSQRSQQIAKGAEDAAGKTPNSSRGCSCSSERTLTGACSLCKVAGGITTGDSSSPTSLREVENAGRLNEAEAKTEEPAVPPPNAENAAENEQNGPEQGNEKNERKTHCTMM